MFIPKAKKEYTRVNKYPIIWLARKQEAVIDGAGQPILVANRVGLRRKRKKERKRERDVSGIYYHTWLSIIIVRQASLIIFFMLSLNPLSNSYCWTCFFP